MEKPVKNKNQTHIVEYELPKMTQKGDEKGPKTALLDPNHTHFLLVDTASSAFGQEVPFRADLEKTIAENLKIPITVLVVGGGFRTAESISQAVAKGTPCVFFEVRIYFVYMKCLLHFNITIHIARFCSKKNF